MQLGGKEEWRSLARHEIPNSKQTEGQVNLLLRLQSTLDDRFSHFYLKLKYPVIREGCLSNVEHGVEWNRCKNVVISPRRVLNKGWTLVGLVRASLTQFWWLDESRQSTYMYFKTYKYIPTNRT